MRRALAALAQAGTVQSRRGTGVFVAAVPTENPLRHRVWTHQIVLASGRSPSCQILRMETHAASVAEAEALDLPPFSQVHLTEGVSLADGVPLALFRPIFPAGCFPGFPEAIARLQPVTVALAECGVADCTRDSTRLTARAADPVQAQHLRLNQGGPLLQSITANVDTAGRRVEFGATWFVGDRLTLTVKPACLSRNRCATKLSTG